MCFGSGSEQARRKFWDWLTRAIDMYKGAACSMKMELSKIDRNEQGMDKWVASVMLATILTADKFTAGVYSSRLVSSAGPDCRVAALTTTHYSDSDEMPLHLFSPLHCHSETDLEMILLFHGVDRLLHGRDWARLGNLNV